MAQLTEAKALTDRILAGISVENVKETAFFFSKLKRATASPDAESASAYICSKLSEYGIPHEQLWYSGYLSSAVSAKLEIISPEQQEFEVVPCGYTKNVTDLEGELIYDRWCECTRLSVNDNTERFRSFAGKVVLTQCFCSDIAREAKEAGALAVIGMYPSPEDVPHYFGASNHNGTPTPENAHLLPEIPCIDCTKAAGERMKTLMKSGNVRVRLSAQADTRVKKASIPVAYIPGCEENFVLVDGHYDSHCEGMTDNGAGDCILLELARVFHKNRSALKRGLVFCWWSGHEFGQYAGSTWYADTFYEKIRDHCVAQINIDVAGSKNARCIRARTTQMEGAAFTSERIRRYTGLEPAPYIPRPHLGEPNFMGKNVPITIMLKYEASPDKVNIWPVGGGYWWHSREDTLDKVDFANALRDANINAEMICEVANSTQLPVDILSYMGETRRMLQEIQCGLEGEFDLSPVFPHLDILQEKAQQFCRALKGRTNTDCEIKKIAGDLVNMIFNYSDPYNYDRLSLPATFPKLRAAMGVTKDNADNKSYLFIYTDFLRQRNRLVDMMDRICDEIDLALLRWNYKQ